MKFFFSSLKAVSKCLNFAAVFFLIATSFIAHAQNPTVISDSLVVQQRLHAKEELIVDQDATFKGEVHVLGESRFETDVKFDEGVKVGGTAKLEGDVQMANLQSVNLTESSEILIVLPNGQLKTVGLQNLITDLYGKDEPCKQITPSHPFPVWSNGTNKIYAYYCDPVNVGIGTSAPLFTLDVRGISYSQKFLAGNTGGSNDALFSGFAQNTSQALINLGIKVGAGSEEARFLITNQGAVEVINVGTNPALTLNNGTGHAVVAYSNSGTKIMQLENNGLLRTREIRIDAASWADFVFDENYELPKLKDVARYIEKNKRLPGIPASQEIQENGINVAEMQTLQMQKIEELTLYMIEMDQKMEQMQGEIVSLKKENAELKKLQRN